MVIRPLYLTRLKESLGTPIIKILTGMRRVGKSSLLRQLIDHLSSDNVQPSQILFIDRENLSWDHIRDYTILHQTIETYFTGKEWKKYLFIDEVQDITEWERTIRHYGKMADYEIFLTWSNSSLLSGELATYLSWRYIEFAIYPLTYAEYLTFRTDGSLEDYMWRGGLPWVARLEDTSIIGSYLEWVMHTVMFRDIIDRHAIRSGGLLEQILQFLASNTGYPTSTKRIADYLKKERITLSFETVRDYLEYFREAFLLHTPRWQDIQGKEFLDLNTKYYFTDIGVRNRLVHQRNEYIGQILENVVYNELVTRWYTVTVGRIGTLEVDFIAEKSGERIYIQVAYLLASDDTVAREFAPLEKIRDNYPKLVLSMDTHWWSGRGGILRENIETWLLQK